MATADFYGKWKHPEPHAIQSDASSGIFLQVVSSQLPSTAWEVVAMG